MIRLLTSACTVLAALVCLAGVAYADGSLPIEGETFSKQPGTKVVSDPMYSGGKALKITDARAVPTKSVTITERSDIVVRGRAAKPSSSPTLTVRVDGSDGGTLTITGSTLENYRYDANREPGTYTVGLKAGNITKAQSLFVDVLTFPADPVEPPPPDTTPPPQPIVDNVEVTGSKADGAKFWFHSSEPVDHFVCKLRNWNTGTYWYDYNCTSPKIYQNLEYFGTYTFSVAGVDAAGNMSPFNDQGFYISTY